MKTIMPCTDVHVVCSVEDTHIRDNKRVQELRGWTTKAATVVSVGPEKVALVFDQEPGKVEFIEVKDVHDDEWTAVDDARGRAIADGVILYRYAHIGHDGGLQLHMLESYVK